MKQFLILSLLLPAIFVYAPNQAHACSCMMTTIQESIDTSDAIFIGTVHTVTQTSDFEKEVTFGISRDWKGVELTGEWVTITTPGDSAMCGFNFVEGKEYLVYARKWPEQEGLSVSLCSRTASLEESNEDVAVLDEWMGVESETPFPDVGPNSDFFDAIFYVKQEGIVSGYEDGTYREGKLINRAELTKIVVGSTFTPQARDRCDPNLIYNFRDAGKKEWYSPYLCVAVQHKIIGGYPDGTFKGHFNVNFVEAAKIIVEADMIDQGGNPRYDRTLPEVEGEWYAPYVQYLSDRGAIPVSITALDQGLTRGEMAEIMFRLRTGNVDKPSRTFDELAGNPDAWKLYSNPDQKVSFSYPGDFSVSSEGIAYDYPGTNKDWFRVDLEAPHRAESPSLVFEVNPDGYGPIFAEEVYEWKEGSDGELVITKETVYPHSGGVDDPANDGATVLVAGSTEVSNGNTYYWRFWFDESGEDLKPLFKEILSTVHFWQ